jgi:hypothetical protein
MMEYEARETTMKITVFAFGALPFVVMLATLPPAQAMTATGVRRPRHWSLIGDVCINDRNGDVILARKK